MSLLIDQSIKAEKSLLLFAHISDLHITQGKRQSYVDYPPIIARSKPNTNPPSILLSYRRSGHHTLQLARAGQKIPERIKNGSDADSIGAWPENGIFGTQLEPNRNGKPFS
ncbi:hypothetical protein [Spirosoma validum]|uniref:Uncharacterized protein n=1 Tax=Spirosoma validum TaxID=2771355 RepID=A0A927B0D7_9BACT|nr:hypothetical protein [Spirosoma validum]MBD2753061.1 hypothetical protein [Spirosoma validum]